MEKKDVEGLEMERLEMEGLEMEGVGDAIYTQYKNSSKLKRIIESFKYVDPTNGIKEIYNKIYNLDTANSYGLDIWGKILNFNRTVELVGLDYFGFKCADYEPFNQFPFYNGMNTGYYVLGDEPYRKILKIICARNLTGSTLPELNNITKKLFSDRGICKVQRVQTMKISFTFNFSPEAWELAILHNKDVVPIPASCDYVVVINKNINQ